MVDAITMLAVAALVAGVVGTLVPLIPGGALSLAGIYLYWWHTGFTEPGTTALLAFTLLGVLTLLAEFAGGAVAARAGGASWQTTAVAVPVAITLLVVAGPVGLLVGLFGTVFVLELVGGKDVDGSLRSALYATVGVLASTAVQVLLTATILAGFLVVVFLL